MNSAERETGKRATRSWKRMQRENGGGRSGRAVFIVVEKATRLVRLRLARSSGHRGGQTYDRNYIMKKWYETRLWDGPMTRRATSASVSHDVTD